MENVPSLQEVKFDESSGTITLPANEEDKKVIHTAKVEVYKILKSTDFVKINGIWEAKRDGMLKILSSAPISYKWSITETQITNEYVLVRGILILRVGSVVREIDGMGVVEPGEMENKPLHYRVAKAETRALKRAIDVAFGSVINAYVKNVLEGNNGN